MSYKGIEHCFCYLAFCCLYWRKLQVIARKDKWLLNRCMQVRLTFFNAGNWLFRAKKGNFVVVLE